MLKVYALNINESVSEEQLTELSAMVSRERRESSYRFRFASDRRRAIYGEALLRYLALTHHGEKTVAIGKTSMGKPYFTSGCSYHFNLSHAGTWLVCGWSSVPVGIDVEECVVENFELKTARDFFHPTEYQQLKRAQSESEQLDWFYQFWTLKESYLKHQGDGLNVNLTTFSFSLPNKACHQPILSNGGTSEPLHFYQEKLDETHQLALCSQEKFVSYPIKVSINQVFQLLKRRAEGRV